MRRRGIVKLLILLVFVALLAQAGYETYLSISNTVQTALDTTQTATNSTLTPVNTAQTTNDTGAVSVQPKEFDISSVQISQEIENLIRQSDAANADKNITNYKKLLVECNVPENYRNEIERLMKNGHAVPDILISYEFLFNNFGVIKELEGLIAGKESGKTFAQVFKDYNSKVRAFTPSSFKSGDLERLMKIPGITMDDIMIADRISQRGLKSFEDLIGMRKQGKAWKEINTETGMVNTADALPRVGATSTQVDKYTAGTGLTEKQVLEALVIAGKMGKPNDVIIAEVKAGYGKEDIYAKCYDEKYR